VAFLFATGCEEKQTPGRAGPESATAPVVHAAAGVHPLQAALTAFNHVSLEEAAALFSDDHVGQLAELGREPIHGRAELLAFWKGLHVALPDVQVQPARIISTKRFWLLEGVLTGTQQGKILDRVATQRKVGTQLALFAWVADGKIHQSFLCGNPLSVLKQIDATSDGYQGPVAPAQPQIVTAESNPALVAATRQFYRDFQDGNLAAVAELMAPGVVIHAYGDGAEIRGLEAVQRVLANEHQLFDGTAAVEEAMSAGPYVVAIVRVMGTVKGDIGTQKVSGKSFNERGIDVFRFEGGRIVEWDNYRNQMDFKTQLGIFPPPKKQEAGEGKK
jgi:ketosteroid isomerase-like protein